MCARTQHEQVKNEYLCTKDGLQCNSFEFVCRANLRLPAKIKECELSSNLLRQAAWNDNEYIRNFHAA